MGRVLTDVKIPTQGASAPNPPTAPTVAAMEGKGQEEDARDKSFPNPNLQHGAHDVGYGWVDCEINEAVEQGYDVMPDGVRSYGDSQYYF